MDEKSVSELKCPDCYAEIVIYKGWANFNEESIKILAGAKWRCPECGKTAKLDEGF